MRPAGSRKEKWAAGVDIEHLVPLPQADPFDVNSFVKSGVVHQDINSAHVFRSLAHGRHDAALIAHVAADAPGANAELVQIGNGALSLGAGFQVGDDDISSRACKPERNLAADAPGGAGDEYALSTQLRDIVPLKLAGHALILPVTRLLKWRPCSQRGDSTPTLPGFFFIRRSSIPARSSRPKPLWWIPPLIRRDRFLTVNMANWSNASLKD